MPPFVRAQLDYYAVLEIYPTAEPVEINAAFRRLAWRYHPDRNPAPGATLQFQDINEAHQVLSDPERRAQYDAEWHSGRDHHRTPRATMRPHLHRRWYRRRRVRTSLLTVFAFLFVSSAWAVIFSAMSSTHFLTSEYVYDSPSPFAAEMSQSCGFSMEMFPISYTDERGHRSTGWKTDVRNCWGGSTWVSSVPDLPSQHGMLTSSRGPYRY